MEQLVLSYTAGGNIKCTAALENSLAAPQRVKDSYTMT